MECLLCCGQTRPPGFLTKFTEWQFHAIDTVQPSENRRRRVIFAPSYFAPALKAGHVRSATPASTHHAPDSGFRVSDFLHHYHCAVMVFRNAAILVVTSAN